MGPSPPHALRGTEASRTVLIREGPEILQHLVLAPGLFHLLLEPDDPAVLAGLRRSVAGKGGFRRLVVFGGPSSQGRILDAEPFGEALRRHLSREHDLGCRDLELPVVAFPSSGHIEHLSPLTWCPIYLTLSKGGTGKSLDNENQERLLGFVVQDKHLPTSERCLSSSCQLRYAQPLFAPRIPSL